MKNGFTLIELSMVILVTSILLVGLFDPLLISRQQFEISQDREILQEIKESLIGYAIRTSTIPSQGRLPCPSSDLSGIEDCSISNQEGFLPYITLGLDSINKDFSNWRYRVDSGFTVAPINLVTQTIEDMLIQNSSGNILGVVPADLNITNSPVAVFYSLGINKMADGENLTADPLSCGNPTGYNDSVLGTTCPAGMPLYELDHYSINYDDVLGFLNGSVLMSMLIKAEVI